MGVATSREREALRVIHRLGGKASAVAVSKALNIGTEYAALLCNSLARGGYVEGAPIKGYRLTPDGEALLEGDPLGGTPMLLVEADEAHATALAERVEGVAGDLLIEDIDPLISELYLLKRQLIEEERAKQVEFRCIMGREFQRNHWGRMEVFVVDDIGRKELITKSKLVKGLTRNPDPMAARCGLWVCHTGRLPSGTTIKICADGGDKEVHYLKYQDQQEWLFVLDREAEELTVLGEYAGTFTARMRPLGDCPLIRRRVRQFTGEKAEPKLPKPKRGWDWEKWA